MRNLVIIVTFATLLVANMYSQETIQKNILKRDIRNPTVQIEYVCQNDNQVWLKLVNETNGNIGVKTFTTYSLPNNSGKFDYLLKKGRKQVKLSDGTIVTTVPSDDDRVNLLYFIEEEQFGNNKRLLLTKVYGNVGAESFIASQDSVLFFVKLKDLSESSEVYVKYQYEWEYTGLRLNSLVPEHRTYFSSWTLANLDQVKCELQTRLKSN